MDPTFLASVFAVPPVLLGRQLRPFCCGHAVILESLESPFVCGGKITSTEIITAIWVCSRSYEEARQKLTTGCETLLDEVQQWGFTVGPWAPSLVNDAFQAYLEEHTKAPQRWQKKDSRPSKSPWALSIVTTLCRELKISISEAWNMPLQEALWHFAALAEQQGDDSLISEDERTRMRVAKEAVHG